MEITKPRLLIVGDSFFSTDPDFSGQHWSEMLPDYQVLNRAAPGNSTAIIQIELVNGLKQMPAAVIVGFTGHPRIAFENTNKDLDRRWITSLHKQWLTDDQKLLTTLYHALTHGTTESFQAFWSVIGTLYFLKNSNIPFVYSLGIYEKLLVESLENYEFMMAQFAQFDSHKIKLNLALYPMDLQTLSAPRFHVPDSSWQRQFASEVTEKLKTLDI